MPSCRASLIPQLPSQLLQKISGGLRSSLSDFFHAGAMAGLLLQPHRHPTRQRDIRAAEQKRDTSDTALSSGMSAWVKSIRKL